MNVEPRMFLSPFYTPEFYNQCHGEDGKFCKGDSGGTVQGKFYHADVSADDSIGTAFNDGITNLNTVWHVTPSDNVDSIQEKGFQGGSGNWGNGTYYSPNRSESLGIYAADAHLHDKDVTILKARTNVQNPLIVEAEDTSNFWGKVSRVLNSDTVSSFHEIYNRYKDEQEEEAARYDESPSIQDKSTFAKKNLKTILQTNNNDGLLVRNPDGGGKGIGGVTLVVPPSFSNVNLVK